MVLPLPFRSVVSVCLWVGVLTGAARRGPETGGGDGSQGPPQMTVASTDDFDLTGDGSALQWERAEWVPLDRRGEGGLHYETRVKVLYSATGLYVLMDGSDIRKDGCAVGY